MATGSTLKRRLARDPAQGDGVVRKLVNDERAARQDMLDRSISLLGPVITAVRHLKQDGLAVSFDLRAPDSLSAFVTGSMTIPTISGSDGNHRMQYYDLTVDLAASFCRVSEPAPDNYDEDYGIEATVPWCVTFVRDDAAPVARHSIGALAEQIIQAAVALRLSEDKSPVASFSI